MCAIVSWHNGAGDGEYARVYMLCLGLLLYADDGTSPLLSIPTAYDTNPTAITLHERCEGSLFATVYYMKLEGKYNARHVYS